MSIPFNKPFIVGKELYHIAQAVLSGHISGNGEFTRKCERWMEERFGAGKVLMTHSCTASLEMAALLADIQPGDEVILPSFTFVSTANAFVLRGASLRFCEIREDTLNMDESLLSRHINARTKAIVPVHYAGVACEMDAICATAGEHGLLVIEDAAQAVNATYHGRHLGTIGDLGCYSFHETKNFICGEGGALAVNDKRLAERSEIIREKGTNRSLFMKGLVDKYTWVDIGSSYLPSDIVSAFLYAQLESSDRITEKRMRIYEHYWEALAPLEAEGVIKRPYRSAHSHNAHMFYVILNNPEARDSLMTYLRTRDIQAVFHYVPLHLSPMGRKVGVDVETLPVTERIASCLLRLPCFYDLTLDQCDYIVSCIQDWVHGKSA